VPPMAAGCTATEPSAGAAPRSAGKLAGLNQRNVDGDNEAVLSMHGEEEWLAISIAPPFSHRGSRGSGMISKSYCRASFEREGIAGHERACRDGASIRNCGHNIGNMVCSSLVRAGWSSTAPKPLLPPERFLTGNQESRLSAGGAEPLIYRREACQEQAVRKTFRFTVGRKHSRVSAGTVLGGAHDSIWRRTDLQLSVFAIEFPPRGRRAVSQMSISRKSS